ncbi:hypothetical protein ABZ069_33685 [Streptomyces microflavus]|uniref:hypothetical protein n=1 Tax=Streptomyces microflavus TaxID=1919 RepID=UPI0033A8C8A3
MKRRRRNDSTGNPLTPGGGLDDGQGRKNDKPKPPMQFVSNPLKSIRAPKLADHLRTDTARLLLTAPIPGGKKPRKPKAAAAKGQKNASGRKQPKSVDARRVAARLSKDAHNAKLDAALQDYERPIPDEVADILTEIIRSRPQASGLPPRRRP